MIDVNRHWYRSSFTWLSLLLLPFSWLFRGVVKCRRVLYRLGIKKNYQFDVPVIVVGNITVGGTGKTPFVIWLANFLKEQGFKPGIVSRGFGAVNKLVTPCLVDASHDPIQVGDEALLLAQRSACPVMIAANRVEAVRALLAQTDCDMVISDDGLQHYRLARQLEIAVVDGVRRFGNNCFLPAGPLREAVSRLKKVDFVIAQQYPRHREYEMQLCGEQLVSIKNATTRPLTEFNGKTVHAVAAIGNPQRFFASLKNVGIVLIEHVFPDHYLFRKEDLRFGDNLPILMTEKDAVKCQHIADEKCWYLPVVAKLDATFSTALSKKITLLTQRI